MAVAIPVHWCLNINAASYSPDNDNNHPAIQAAIALMLPSKKANEIAVFKSAELKYW